MRVAAGEAVESTIYEVSSCDTRYLSVTGRTVVPVSTVLIVPPWWKMIPIIQAKNFAERGPTTIKRPADSANVCAPPVRVHRPIRPPSAHR
jgi:hypothetical protein